MRFVTGLGLVSVVCGCAPSEIAEQEQSIASVTRADLCGTPGSGCEILASSLANPRSISKIKSNGEFFLASAGDPLNDLFGEAIVGTGTDLDSSAIFKWNDNTGLQPWISNKPSQLLVVFDPTFGGPTPYQAGINGVETHGNDLFYTITYNAGTSNYVDRMRSYTSETGISFGELRKISNGVNNPSGAEVILADVAQLEVNNNNPDGVVYQTPDTFGHDIGDDVFATNPYGLLPQNNKTYVIDVAANDIYRVKSNGKIDLEYVFPTLNGGERVPINLFEGPGNKLYVTFFYGINGGSPEALGGIAQLKSNGGFEMVSFNRMPISAAFGPDGCALYVLEFANQYAPNSGRILRVTPKNYGNYFNGKPVSDGVVVVDGLNYPVDLEFDSQGRLVVLESGSLNPFAPEGRLLRFSL